MSLVLLESFDIGALALALRWGNNVDGTITPVRTGDGFRMNANSADDIGPFIFPAAMEHATITMGFALRISNPPSVGTDGFLDVKSDGGATGHLEFYESAARELVVLRTGGVELGRTAPIFQNGVIHYLELRMVLSDAAGEVQAWIDNNQVLNLTGVDTKNAGAKAVFDSVMFTCDTGDHGQYDIDDLYITNGAGAAPYNGRLGDISVECHFPAGNGNSSGFTGSDADQVDNYLLVDEANHDSDTTYVEAAADGLIDLYAVTDLSVASAELRGVQESLVARHTGVGDNFRGVTRISGTNYNGADQAATAGYSEARQVWETSPATATHWAVAEVNAAEFGQENRP